MAKLLPDSGLEVSVISSGASNKYDSFILSTTDEIPKHEEGLSLDILLLVSG